MAFVYNCCFWFSLRLAGIMIGIFSMVQGALLLAALCAALDSADAARARLSAWMQQTVLSFTESFFQNVLSGLQSYITLGIVLTSIYLALCMAFVYGAYKCNVGLMVGYLLAEVTRLMAASALLVVALMLLKENTMDIGQLIGASILGGFAMLFMFYLWVCAVNLPVLIGEVEREEHLETISHLQRLLERSQRARGHHGDMDDLLATFPAAPALATWREAPIRAGGVKLVSTVSSDPPRRVGYRVASRQFLL